MNARRRSYLRWAAALTVVGVLEHVDPLSPLIREALRTSTPLGRAVFLAGVTGGVAWFVPHILTAAEESLSSVDGER